MYSQSAYNYLWEYSQSDYFGSVGVNILDLYIWSIPLPVSVFYSSGSTPTSTIPLLWECSQNNGIVPLGVLPDLLKSDTGT